MCTVSWRRTRDGYDLFFNRDELTTRAPESPPMRDRRDGIEFLAPRDGARGGTWLVVNEHSVTVCLLNDYANPWRPHDAFSRGEIVLACAAAANLADVSACVRAQPLSRVAPFHLLALAPGVDPLLLHWGGTELAENRSAMVSAPISSSSFATAEVVAARVRRFSAYVREPAAPTVAELAAYHRQHDPRACAHSVLMRRPDAATRSLCHVQVDGPRVSLAYEAADWTAAGPVMAEPRLLALACRPLASGVSA